MKNQARTTPCTRGWPPERRKAQAQRIRRQRPWLKSTGPRTAAGKNAVKQNARKHGRRSAEIRALRSILHRQSLYRRKVMALLQLEKQARRDALEQARRITRSRQIARLAGLRKKNAGKDRVPRAKPCWTVPVKPSKTER